MIFPTLRVPSKSCLFVQVSGLSTTLNICFSVALKFVHHVIQSGLHDLLIRVAHDKFFSCQLVIARLIVWVHNELWGHTKSDVQCTYYRIPTESSLFNTSLQDIISLMHEETLQVCINAAKVLVRSWSLMSTNLSMLGFLVHV